MREEASVDAFLVSFEHAYNQHDPVALSALFAEEALWLAAAGPVIERRSAIEPALGYFMASLPPRLTLTGDERIVVGDHAIVRGTYALAGERGGEPVVIAGAYLDVLERFGDGWRIAVQQMNYAFDITPDLWVGSIAAVEALPSRGELGALGSALAEHLDSGKPDEVATLFGADGCAAFAGRGWAVGRADVAAALRECSDAPVQLVVHETSTQPLGLALAVDTGWYELRERGARTRWGTYTVLARLVSGDEWEIVWLAATASARRAPDVRL